MSTRDQTTFTATAVYADMAAARLGVEALEEAGIEADDITLEGSAAREAADTGDTQSRDAAFLQRSARTLTIGVLRGGLIGALLGVVVGLLIFAVGDSPGGVDGIAAFAIGGFMAGTGIGLAETAYRRMKQSQAFEATLEDDVEGAVAVAASAADRPTLDKVVAALEATAAQRVTRMDTQGNEVPA